MYRTPATANKRRPYQQSRAVAVSLPAPVGGWNARDSSPTWPRTMPSFCKISFPGTTSVSLRLGHSQFATGLGTQVETLISYAGAATTKLIGIAGGSVYDASSGGAVGAAALSGLTNSRWQYVNVTTAAATSSRCATAPIASTRSTERPGRTKRRDYGRYELDPHQYQRPQEPRLVHPEGHAEGVVSAYAVHYRRGQCARPVGVRVDGRLPDGDGNVDDRCRLWRGRSRRLHHQHGRGHRLPRHRSIVGYYVGRWSGYSRSAHPSAGVAS
jgi:hypothetical protein